jgi:hypothetical protein
MTEAEIAAVVESAAATKRLIAERYKNLEGKRAPDRLKLRIETDVQIEKAFDRARAERFLNEYPEHQQARFVLRVKQQLDVEALWRRLLESIQISLAEIERLKLEPSLQTLLTESEPLAKDADALLDVAVSEDTRKQLKLLSERIKEVREWAQEMRTELERTYVLSRFRLEGGIEVAAKQLSEDFEAKEIAALRKYGYGNLLVHGNIGRISADFMDKPTVHLTAGHRFQEVLVTGVPAEIAAGLKKRETFATFCDRVSEAGGTPICHSSCNKTLELADKTLLCYSARQGD